MSAVERPMIDDTGSLSEHEAQFLPTRAAKAAAKAENKTVSVTAETEPIVEPPSKPVPPPTPESDGPTDEELAANPNLAYEKPAEKERHRAESQKARAKDVPRINELTRKLREAEEKLKTLEAAAKPAPMPSISAPPPVSRQPAPVGTFPVAKPKIEDFAKEEDPYEAKVLAVARWERQKEAWENQQVYHQRQTQQTEQALVGKITAQVQAFVQQKPDYPQVIESMKGEQAPDLLMAALAAGPQQAPDFVDKFPELVYVLGQHPVLRHEMHLITDGRPVTPQNIVATRRLLEARVQAVTTGAAAPHASIARTPKPPTPVRTGPITTGEEPPGDGASLADHEQFYSKRKRR